MGYFREKDIHVIYVRKNDLFISQVERNKIYFLRSSTIIIILGCYRAELPKCAYIGNWSTSKKSNSNSMPTFDVS